MMVLSVFLALTALVVMARAHSFPRLLVGLQLLLLAGSSAFVFVGARSAAAARGQAGGFLLLIAMVPTLVIGLALAVRLFFQRKRVGLDELRELKQ